MKILPTAADLTDGDRLVDAPWARLFAIAALVALTVLAAWEGYWRRHGVGPSLSDIDASWSVARDWVEPESIVLVGTSKIQSALDPELLGERLDEEAAIQLALINGSPLPILEHLARDEEFRGTVVVDVSPRIFFDRELRHERRSRAILEAYRAYRTSPGDRIDARLVMTVESSLVLRRAEFSLRRVLETWTKPRPLQIPFARVRFDRFRELDFSRLDLAVRRSTQTAILAAGEPATAQDVAALADRTRRAAAAIERRGGRVLLALLPVTGSAREAEERLFPRGDYWQELVEKSGLEAVHFADYPELGAFECPDGVHLEADQARRFTEAFATHLE
ncbi:MAG: hypothetical protein R3244_00700 [Thermoanaerobaculia bacterium]|nr:hypothetical protein [Thermoanaerobaculia bacterium]